MLFLQKVELVAARGAAQLHPDACRRIAVAIRSRQCSCGGFAGLDKSADAYYSLFAWLCLRALGECFDDEALYLWLRSVKFDKRVDRYCAAIVLAAAGELSQMRMWQLLVGLVCGGQLHELYTMFLLGVVAERVLPAGVVRFFARQVWRRIAAKKVDRHTATPRVVVRVIAACLGGVNDSEGVGSLMDRRVAGGGFASVAGVAPDLLATGVACFALWLVGASGFGRDVERVFVELCWQEDDLFSASPMISHGDIEHTLYGLLALGGGGSRTART